VDFDSRFISLTWDGLGVRMIPQCGNYHTLGDIDIDISAQMSGSWPTKVCKIVLQ
jgi:hypothetical protein